MKLAAKIEAFVAEQGLVVGDRLPAERVLAKRLGVSRPRLREAIQQLVSRGIVVSRHGGGTFVADRTAPLLEQALRPLEPLIRRDRGYWQDVMELRKALDPEAAFYAARRAGAEDRSRIAAALEDMQAAAGSSPDLQASADVAFHLVIAEASQNIVLRQVLAGLSALLRESISESLAELHAHPQQMAALQQQHHAIATAILAGNAEEARRAMTEHLAFVETSLRSIEQDASRIKRRKASINTPLKPGSRP
ncbi:FCD domain-containing protein [Allorhizobium undicola]|uniref:FCD domain-containing protein n=1 Tax=Allorhizobium undicola TaxID=78527 RepID=UPI003D358865